MKTAALKLRGRWLNMKVAAGPLPSPVDAVAAEATPLVDLLAVVDPFLRARERRIHHLELLRLEQVAPLAAVHAELLDIGDERLEILRLGDDLDRIEIEVLGRRLDDRRLVARPPRHEEHAVRVRREPDLLLAGEIEERLGSRRLLQGPVAGSVVDDRDPLARRVEQAAVGRHHRIRREHARIPEMRVMPFVAVFQPDAQQIRADAPRAEEVRHVEGELARLGHRAPAARLAGHRAHELRMAVPAAFAQVDVATALLQRRVVGRVGDHPFQLAEIGADDRADLGGPRRRLEERQEALGDESREKADDARDQGDEAAALIGLLRRPGIGVVATSARLSAPGAGRTSAVSIRLMTSSVMPISMLTPATVRRNQYGRIDSIESTHSVAGHPLEALVQASGGQSEPHGGDAGGDQPEGPVAHLERPELAPAGARPDVEQPAHRPHHEGAEHRQVRVRDDEVGEVGRLLDLSAAPPSTPGSSRRGT